MARTLRVLQVVIQTHLVWDDGTELTPGPQLDPVVLPASRIAEFAATLPADVEKIAAQYGEP